MKDFLATIQSSSYFQSEIAKLRHDVEEYAKQFPTIGFDKETMKYNKWEENFPLDIYVKSYHVSFPGKATLVSWLR